MLNQVISAPVRPATSTLTEAQSQWFKRPQDERFQTLEALRAKVHGRRLRSRSLDVDRQDVVAETDGEQGIVINSKITACAPTHWAFGQLCQASKINGAAAPANYLRQLPNKLAVECLNQGFRSGDREGLSLEAKPVTPRERRSLRAHSNLPPPISSLRTACLPFSSKERCSPVVRIVLTKPV